MIETDPVLFMYFTQMFGEQSRMRPPAGSGDIKVKDCFRQMLAVINHVLTTAPTYNDTGMVGFPINAILDFPMITPAGLAAFAAPKVNDMLRKVLAVWTQFLDSEDWLLHVLGGSGGDGSGVQFADDEVDHRDEVAVGAVSAGSAFRGLDQRVETLEQPV